MDQMLHAFARAYARRNPAPPQPEPRAVTKQMLRMMGLPANRRERRAYWREEKAREARARKEQKLQNFALLV